MSEENIINHPLTKIGWDYCGAGLWSFEGDESMSTRDAYRLSKTAGMLNNK